MRRNGATDVLDDLVQQFRFFQQNCAATGFIHGLGRATEVQVDDFRAQLAGQRGVFRQAHRIGTQQLHAQRHTGGGPGTVEQLRAELVEIGRRQQLVVDPNELGHAPVNTTHAGQYIAQDVVDQPLHGRQSNLHEKHTQRKTCGSLLVFTLEKVNPVGAAEGCDLLILLLEDQKIAAFGSSYTNCVRPEFATPGRSLQ
ncbi:hypothetical protein D3C85_1111060 [compost metagenome]